MRGTASRYVIGASVLVLGGVSVSAHAQTLAPEETFDITIGTMCIGDMPVRARTRVRSIQQGSDFYDEWTLEWRAGSTSEPVPPVAKPPKSIPKKGRS